MTIFRYNEINYVHHGRDETSEFDKLLLSKWNLAMKNGFFNYKISLEDRKIRFLDYHGSKIILQLNTLRFTEKRKAEIIEELNLPFNPNKFNFNKINPKEILFRLKREDENNDDSLIIINNSPIEIGHILLVPNCKENLNQVATLDSIRKAIDTLLLSNSNNFIVGFNSLCALASVNHLHFHAYYLPFDKDYWLPIQDLKAKKLINNLWLYESFLIPAIAIQLSDFNNDIIEFSKKIHLVTEYFSKKQIAHNLVLVRGLNLNKENDNKTVRALIWPRKSYKGAKDDDKSMKFHLAICELSGHIVIKEEEAFNSINYQDLVDAAYQIRFDSKEYDKIIEELENIK